MDNYYYSDRFKNILSYYEECVAKQVPCIVSCEDYCDIAEYYDELSDRRRAKEVLETAMALYPDTQEPIVMRARMSLSETGSTGEARRLLSRVTDKNDDEYVYTMAEILIIEGKRAQLNAFLIKHERLAKEEDLLDGPPDEGDNTAHDGYCMDIAEIFLDFHMIQPAERWLKKVDDKTSAEYKELQGRVLMNAGRYEECEQVMNGLLDADPFSRDYWNTLATSQFLRGDISRSISSSEYSIAIDPNDTQAMQNRANGLFLLGNHDEALKCYERLTEMLPDDGLSYICLALCHLCKHDTDAARDILAEGMKKRLPPQDYLHTLMLDVATAFCRLGCPDDAVRCLDKLDAIVDDDEHVAQSLVTRGYVRLANDDTDGARSYFDKAIRLADGSPDIAFRIVVAMLDNGVVTTAHDMLKSLMSFCDMSEEKAKRSLIYTQGYAYMALGYHTLKKKREFVSYVRKAVEADRFSAHEILSHLFPDDMSPDDYPAAAKNMKL